MPSHSEVWGGGELCYAGEVGVGGDVAVMAALSVNDRCCGD